ncbi:MAG: YwaF family protein [Clostridia bacterium]|nr:YwaF family protein [Clostridia bacterium]
MVFYYVWFFIALALSLLLITLFYIFFNKNLGAILKVIALVLSVFFIFRYCLNNLFLESFNYENFIKSENKLGFVFAFILHWLSVTGFLIITMRPFFNSVIVLNVLSYAICPIIFFCNAIFLKQLLYSNFGSGVFLGTLLQGVFLCLEVGVELALSLFYLFTFFKKKNRILKTQYFYAGIAFLGMVLATMPNYTLQIFFDPYNYAFKVDKLNFWHRIYIYPIFIVPIILYLILRNKPKQTRLFALLYYSLSGLILYTLTHQFKDFLSVSNLPFHLCNTALYVTPLCLMLRAKKVFYFTYFINVLGAFFAIMMPNFNMNGINGTVLISDVLLFFRSHYQAFYMPILVVGLSIFERPRLREFKYSLVGFFIYYVFVLILNAWFYNYDTSVDYFFINSNFIASKLGLWAENLRNVIIEVKIKGLTFKFYPIYQTLFFIVYVILSLITWFIYSICFKVVLGLLELENKQREYKSDMQVLIIALKGKNIGEPMNENLSDKLVLKNLTKRYASSNVYAVKDANLEVCGGEVFGFLGPNGAGKSTIIKSIVGIQTISSGSISVCGYDVKTQEVMAKRQIGFVPDHYALYEKLTAREYVNFIADLYEVEKSVRDSRLNNLIKQFEFEHAIDNPIKTYSHGMKQKVTIMSALIHEPKVWILDEPLTGLDPNSIYQVKECMKNHAKKGNIVFFSSHIIDVVEKICDKIAIIQKGQIQLVESVKNIEEKTTLEKFYMSVITSNNVEAIKFENEKVV